tara:strand:+ start:23131 stop:24492 length:1362 start_codon:yes stop_codon:yes gene_type:complete
MKNLSVATVGNATLVAYDKIPILVTDPWFGDRDPAYFGSWILNYEIPESVLKDIHKAEYIWISHGHPDHLNSQSLLQLKGKKILLPDHLGSRISSGLLEQSYQVEILPDRKWVDLTENIRVLCITTLIQDAVLLIDIGGRLFVNLNDAGSRNCTGFIRNIVKGYKDSYLLSLSGYGDADMINCYDEIGNFIIPPARDNTRVGEQLGMMAKSLGIKTVIPFSSHHQYQREDSIWAQEYTTPIESYCEGLPKEIAFIPPFIRLDCGNGNYEELSPNAIKVDVKKPEEFGDNWSDELDSTDKEHINNYFQRKKILKKFLSFISFKVGGKEHTVSMKNKFDKGITFEVPRNSLMITIKNEIFDDLLIGNFMKTTLHGLNSLYDYDVSTIISKYADNGLVETEEELRAYLREYKRRAGREFIYDSFLDKSKSIFRRLVSSNRGSKIYRSAKSIYYKLK